MMDRSSIRALAVGRVDCSAPSKLSCASAGNSVAFSMQKGLRDAKGGDLRILPNGFCIETPRNLNTKGPATPH